MKNLNLPSLLTAGLGATAAMTGLMFIAPLMGLPPMDIGGMLATFMHVPVVVGWLAHVMIGLALSAVYALVLRSRKGRSGPWGGMLFALAPWLMAQLVMLPLMGAPLFGGSMGSAMGSLMGHLLFGAVLGGLYRPLAPGRPVAPAATATR